MSRRRFFDYNKTMTKLNYRTRRIISLSIILTLVASWLIINPGSYEQEVVEPSNTAQDAEQLEPLGAVSETAAAPDSEETQTLAVTILEKLEIKGRAPKTGYDRAEQFYKSWPSVNGCSLRQVIIKRELGDTATLADDGCTVTAGSFIEPYTGSQMTFYQKSDFSQKIQIDHIVALSDAWQKGAQQKAKDERYALATDPLNLIAVDSAANKQKSDGDAATWLPSNKAFRCQYVARQVSVKYKYGLWVTQAEHDAIANVLKNCPKEPAVGI